MSLQRFKLYAVKIRPGYNEKLLERLSWVLELDEDEEFNWIDYNGRAQVERKLNEFLRDGFSLDEIQMMDADTGELGELPEYLRKGD